MKIAMPYQDGVLLEHFGRAKLYSVMMRYVVPVVMLILFLTSTGFWNLLFRH